ncbi:ABC transporter permease [Actinoplanes sp. NPDC089786]|uniref:ABC transporter permease n=1 Tax=Actinoplanes sp. NPDC089786 TaxID=3155185 RepID=UPI00342EB2FE
MRRPAVHWPSVRGRARADAGSLLLVAIVVAVVSLLAGATPALLRSTADDAIREAVRAGGDDAAVIAQAKWEYDDVLGGRQRFPALAQDVDLFRKRAAEGLDPGLARALRPPIAVVTAPSFDITDGSLLRTFQYNYLADARPFASSRVTWVGGVAPGPSAAPNAVSPNSGPPWPVQVGVSEATAAALKLGPGDRIPLKDEFLREKLVTISGVFRADDPADPAWRLAPWLLAPVPGVDGVGSTRLGGLLSAESLPDARLAVESELMDRMVHFEADPAQVSSGTARSIASTLVTLQATSSASSVFDTSLQWRSQLDNVLRIVQRQVNAATAQASVLLTAVLTGTVLVLLLAAFLLARRRAVALTAARHRGAGLADLTLELLIESSAVALLAAAIGVAGARLVTPGVAWWWAVPVAVAAVVAGPLFGVLVAARATSDRRAPANRGARRRLHRAAALRRVAIEAAVVLAAAGAIIALRQRGILPDSAGATGGALDPFDGQESTSALAASAPALGVVGGALVLLRLLPVLLRFVLRRALRSSRPLAVFGAAQAAANSARTLPILVMIGATALASFALVLGATASRGLSDAAWRVVGGDVRVEAGAAAGVDLTALARRVAAAPGVDHVVTAQVTEGARIANSRKLVEARLVVVDLAAYRSLLADTPMGMSSATGAGIPALVRSADGSLAPGMTLSFPRKDKPAISLNAVGPAPVIGDSGDAVYVDFAALRAAGVDVVPDTMWVTGPGAAAAVEGTPGVGITTRSDVARSRQDAPLTAGLMALTWVVAGTLAALGLLGFALGAAAGAPERWATLGRLRTLGLRLSETRTVAAGELLPPVLLAAVGGPLLGVLLAYLTFGSLALRLLVGWDTDPATTVPWLPLGVLALVFVAAVPVAGFVEATLRRRQGLGELLRVE